MNAAPPPPDRRRRSLVLSIPLGTQYPCSVIRLPRLVGVTSAEIQGGPLGEPRPRAADEHAVRWCAGRRRTDVHQENPRALALLARLGLSEFAHRLPLHGRVIVTGHISDDEVHDIPPAVLDAARNTGLLNPVANTPTGKHAQGACDLLPIGPLDVEHLGGDLPRHPVSTHSPANAAMPEPREVLARVLDRFLAYDPPPLSERPEVNLDDFAWMNSTPRPLTPVEHP